MLARLPVFVLITACNHDVSLETLSVGRIQVEFSQSGVPGVVANAMLGPPQGGCPTLESETSVSINGIPPAELESSWGGMLDETDCEWPTFDFSLAFADDAELVLDGGGHRVDVVIPHALVSRSFALPPSTLVVARGAVIRIPWNGAQGDAPVFDALLWNDTVLAKNIVTTSDDGGVTVVIPADAPLGVDHLQLEARSIAVPSRCTGIVTCAADVYVISSSVLTVTP